MKVFRKEYALAYDYLYQEKDYEKECDFIEAIFSNFSGKVKSILDMGCGAGGHALILARRGYYVVGVDRSEEMLEIAKRKVEEANLSIKFIKGDITNIDLQEKFDAVISMFAVMSYQTNNSAIWKACRVARNHLKRGGLFLFDCWNGLAVLTEKPTARIKEVILNEKEKIIRFTEPILNALTHTIEVRFKVWKISDGHLVNETEESHLMRFLFPQEIKYFLEVAGFHEIKFCPFLKLEKPLKESDWNMTVIVTAK
jgi:SAM-dependent methyltransferase